MRPFALTAALAAASLAASAASAVTIVQYDQTNGGPTIQLVNSAGGAFTLSTIGGAAPVMITLFDPANAANTLDVMGEFRFTATGSEAAVVAGNVAFQDFGGGQFSLTALSSVNFLGQSGTNILSGTFTGGTLSGQLSGLSPTFQVTIPTSELESTSDFFPPERFFLSNFSLGMSDASRGLRIGADGRVAGFNAASVGTFGALDTSGNPSAIPEPGTWAMMILGFGLVGATMRRRNRGMAHVQA